MKPTPSCTSSWKLLCCGMATIMQLIWKLQSFASMKETIQLFSTNTHWVMRYNINIVKRGRANKIDCWVSWKWRIWKTHARGYVHFKDKYWIPWWKLYFPIMNPKQITHAPAILQKKNSQSPVLYYFFYFGLCSPWPLLMHRTLHTLDSHIVSVLINCLQVSYHYCH